MTVDQVWLSGARGLLDETISLRRRIHEQPELGLDLPVTTKAVLDALRGLDVEIDRGPSTSGLIVTLKGPSQGATVLLRGDMDALPMDEDTSLPFASKEKGRMHACGHDAHTAMLTGAVKLLHRHRDRLAGTVKFMFQPGEEGHFGALRMIEDGLLEKAPKPSGAFAIHVTTNQPFGVFASKTGALLASTDEVSIKVWGKGGHAAMPYLALDPIPIACEIVTALQAMVTRRINPFDPVILTIAKIESGTTRNVIPETATLLGTLRSVSAQSRKIAREAIERTATKIAEAHGAKSDVVLTQGYDPTINDGRMVSLAAGVAKDMLGDGGYITMPAPIMGGEDWSYVLQRVPGCMFFLGVAPKSASWRDAAPLHSNRMTLEEEAMASGIALHAAVAERFLASGFSEEIPPKVATQR
jgi:hippurate hydrolase